MLSSNNFKARMVSASHRCSMVQHSSSIHWVSIKNWRCKVFVCSWKLAFPPFAQTCSFWIVLNIWNKMKMRDGFFWIKTIHKIHVNFATNIEVEKKKLTHLEGCCQWAASWARMRFWPLHDLESGTSQFPPSLFLQQISWSSDWILSVLFSFFSSIVFCQ